MLDGEDDLVGLRRELHAAAEPSNDEAATAGIVRDFLAQRGLEPVAHDVGGHGLLYRVGDAPRVLFRADLDALPLKEATGAAYAATGAHHACGHDGHMAMLAGALLDLLTTAGTPGAPGAYGLFQPAEETGEGALGCLAHPALDLDLDGAYAIHNVPGLELGAVAARQGVAAVASRGLSATMTGTTSHASEPHAGHNPIPALAHLALDAVALPNQHLSMGTSGLVALVHLEAGARRFGTSAGAGVLRITLRADGDEEVATLESRFRDHAKALATATGMSCSVDIEEPFPATVNDDACVAHVAAAAQSAGLRFNRPERPQPWSEDWGHALRRWPGALILLGSGIGQPALHAPQYDFPDQLIPCGVKLWTHLARIHA